MEYSSYFHSSNNFKARKKIVFIVKDPLSPAECIINKIVVFLNCLRQRQAKTVLLKTYEM